MKTSLIILIGCLFSFNSFGLTLEPIWLVADDHDKVHEELFGNGYEEGFRVVLKLHSLEPMTDSTNTGLTAFVRDNRADCSVAGPFITESVEQTNSIGFLNTIVFEVLTSVEADTGGCTVDVIKPNDGLAKTVDYIYVTDY